MRATSVLFACTLAALLFLTFAINEAMWKPTERDLSLVHRAVISVPPKCEGAKYPGTRKFLGEKYLKYPETNFQAVWLPGPPKLTFFAKDGEILRDISLVMFEAGHITTVLSAWGFEENAQEAFDHRTRTYMATSGQFKVEPAAELKRDENGNIELPGWFVKRQEAIKRGEIDPDDPTGIPRAAPTLDEDGNPWFIKTPLDPNAPVYIPAQQEDKQDNIVNEGQSASNDASSKGIETIEIAAVEQYRSGKFKPIEVNLKPGERTVINLADIVVDEAPTPHDEL